MAIRYLVTEDLDRLLVEDGSAVIVLEDSTSPEVETDASGVAYDLIYRNRTEAIPTVRCKAAVQLSVVRRPQVVRLSIRTSVEARPLIGVTSAD